eukprot:g5966.t1
MATVVFACPGSQASVAHRLREVRDRIDQLGGVAMHGGAAWKVRCVVCDMTPHAAPERAGPLYVVSTSERPGLKYYHRPGEFMLEGGREVDHFLQKSSRLRLRIEASVEGESFAAADFVIRAGKFAVKGSTAREVVVQVQHAASSSWVRSVGQLKELQAFLCGQRDIDVDMRRIGPLGVMAGAVPKRGEDDDIVTARDTAAQHAALARKLLRIGD